MYFANELEKLHYFSIFICISRKNVVYLHPQFHAGDVCASSAGVADILKRRLLTLCSGDLKLRNFHLYAGLSNGRCPTGYRLSLLCLLVLVHLLRICVCAHAYLNYVAREYIYIRRGLRVVGLTQWAMRRPQLVERQQSDSTLFLYAESLNHKSA